GPSANGRAVSKKPRPDGSARRRDVLAVPPVPGQHQRGTCQLSRRPRYGAQVIIQTMKTIFFLTVVVSLFACSAAPAQQPENAARVGSRTITTKELDDRWR